MLDFNKMNIIGREIIECAGSTTETVFTGSITGMQELISYHIFNKEFTKKEKAHYICIKETTRFDAENAGGPIKKINETFIKISEDITVLRVIPYDDKYLLRILYKGTGDMIDVVLSVENIKKLLIGKDVDSILLMAELEV